MNHTMRALMAGTVLGLAALALAACGRAEPPPWSGYVEGDYVHVAAPVAGTLATLAVRRGQTVAAGTALFALDGASEQAQRDEAAARADSARAQAANATKGRRADELAVTEQQLVQARAQAALAEAELSRAQALVAQGFLSPARLDDARTALQQSQARVAELGAALRVGRLPARADERDAALAQARAASAALAQARWREQQTQQRAAVAGLVADTFFEPGEWVGAGQPVVSLLPAGALRARFFVPESDIATLQVGQAVRLRCDGCGTPIEARVDFIANRAEYTPPVIYSNTQRARLVFLVEARPVAADAARLRPGQPLDVQPAGVTPR